MFKLSDNYHLRKCFFEREQVPTQTQMINKMSPPLAQVYFKSMIPKLRVLAGLEPPLKGGGADWFIPPQEVLGGRVVMKPVKNKHLALLSAEGVGHFSQQIVEEHLAKQEEEKLRVLLESDINWKKTIEVICRQQWEDSSKEAAERNSEAIQKAFREFTNLYTTSITKIEQLLFDSAIKEIELVKETAYDKMNKIYETRVKQQATQMYDVYEKKLAKEKAKLKASFIDKVEKSRTVMGDQIHDINVEKHIVVEKLRQFLECQNLACQVYVALKEREECQKEIDLAKHEHKKEVKKLKEELALKDFEIRLAKEKERKRIEFNKVWQKKVCHIVKKLQIFISYCLHTLPEHAAFFLDMEKLMLLQLNDAIESPEAESIFEPEPAEFHTPQPNPHPFYLVCDRDFKARVDNNLCPKHCTSSASQLPVIVVNDRFVYSACDNFDKFTDKITQFIHGRRGNDVDFQDDHSYTFDVPIKYTTEQQTQELKLQSSMLQLLQNELPNVRDVPTECCLCKIPFCFCSPLHASKLFSISSREQAAPPPIPKISSGTKIKTRDIELKHEREPKWESYMEYVASKKCKCHKTAKHHYKEHLPAYMRKESKFTEPEIPNYEMCTVDKLRKMVKRAQRKPPPPVPPPKVPSRTREIGVQYSDQLHDSLCNCFSDEELDKLLKELLKGVTEVDGEQEHFKIVSDDVSSSYMTREASSFATECAFTLRSLLDKSPQLEEIFKKKNCNFD